MLKLFARMACALPLMMALHAAPADASVFGRFTGTSTSGLDFEPAEIGLPRDNSENQAAGLLQIRYTFSAPVDLVLSEVYDRRTWIFTQATKDLSYGTGEGDDGYVTFYTPIGTGTEGVYRFLVPTLQREGTGDLWEEIWFNPYVFTLEFNGYTGPPISYTVTVSAVPEPATWALMIAGFGLAGAAIRHQRKTAFPS